MLQHKLTDTRYKLLPETMPAALEAASECSFLRNEAFSLQLALRYSGNDFLPVSVSIDCALPVTVYKQGYVPVADTCVCRLGEERCEKKESGLFPDPLYKKSSSPKLRNDVCSWSPQGIFSEQDDDETLNLSATATKALLLCVNEDKTPLAAGKYPLTVKVTSLSDGSVIAEETAKLTVVDALLPSDAEVKLYYTDWFHVDCLCDTYGIEPYSEEFYRIFRSMIKNAVKHSMNTLLLPAFTPPLDTLIGRERMNVQLVDVMRDGGWRFGFERMRRYIREAKACGIRYFEHCHLFTQWGAEHAPAIYMDGKRIFGWDTDILGDGYADFLKAYIPAFLAFAKEEGIEERLVFHVSDEPGADREASYRRAADSVRELLKGHVVADALSDYLYCEKGLVETPIVEFGSSGDFIGRCPHFWLYHTGVPRTIPAIPAVTRAIGVQMYMADAEGFLHWGLNYYYDRLSVGRFDPVSQPDGYKGIPGVSYLCYPGRDGSVIPCIRQKHMDEAMNDFRALRLLEKKQGREKTLALCAESGITPELKNTPARDALIDLRRKVNALLDK